MRSLRLSYLPQSIFNSGKLAPEPKLLITTRCFSASKYFSTYCLKPSVSHFGKCCPRKQYYLFFPITNVNVYALWHLKADFLICAVVFIKFKVQSNMVCKNKGDTIHYLQITKISSPPPPRNSNLMTEFNKYIFSVESYFLGKLLLRWPQAKLHQNWKTPFKFCLTHFLIMEVKMLFLFAP